MRSPSPITAADLEYAYAHRGGTRRISGVLPVALAQRVDQGMLDWLVPGLRAEQIEFLLKSLPKALRVPLMPIAPKVAELAALLEGDAGLDGLRRLVHEKYGVSIPSNSWRREQLPDHLRPRIAITGAHSKIVASGMDLDSLIRVIDKHETPLEQQAWARALQQWERYDLRSCSFNDVPERLDVTGGGPCAGRHFPAWNWTATRFT